MGIWTRKSVKSLAEHSLKDQSIIGTPSLKRVLGAWDLVLLGIGCVIGAGLFSLTGVAAAENAGPAITIAFLIAALGCLFSGLCYSELASMIPLSGSAYTYAYATMGEMVAWIMGWNLILEYAIGSSAVSISWSAYVVSLLQDFNINLPVEIIASPWQSVPLPDGTRAYGWINLPAVAIIWLISSLLVVGIRESSIVNAIIVGIKVTAVLVFTAAGFFYINTDNYTPFIPENTGVFGEFGWSGILRASGVLFFAYVGFDAVSTAAQETKNPYRNVPIGILGSLAICTLLYVLFGFVMTGLVNYKDLDVAAPVALAVEQIPFPWMHGLMKIAVLAGLTSVILVLLLGQSRIFYTMSKDGLLPPWISDIHKRYQTPWKSNIALMFFASFISAFAPISEVGRMTSIGTLLAFTIVCMGVLILRYTDPHHPRPFRTPFSPVVPLLGIIVCLAMMLSLSVDAWYRLFAWFAIGMIIYFSYGYRHASKQ